MISIEDVEHVAKLARLSLSEEEKKRFLSQMDNILDYFNQLKEVDTTDVEPMSQPVPSKNIMRNDEIVSCFNRDEILANAPEEENGFFKVPKISEE